MMCGIVGCIGKRDAYPVLMQAPRRLQCRGGNSAGVALIDKKRRLNVLKVKGKNSCLETFVSRKDVFGTVFIACRSLIAPEEFYRTNAHPHFSFSRHFTLICRGSIQNHVTLKEKPHTKGFVFPSATEIKVPVCSPKYFRIFNVLTRVWQVLPDAGIDRTGTGESAAVRKSSRLAGTFKCLEPLRVTRPLRLSACDAAVCGEADTDVAREFGEAASVDRKKELFFGLPKRQENFRKNSLDAFRKQSKHFFETIETLFGNSRNIFFEYEVRINL